MENHVSKPSQGKAELSSEELARQRAQLDEMIAEIERLPIRESDDGFSGRDHDRVLYGKQ